MRSKKPSTNTAGRDESGENPGNFPHGSDPDHGSDRAPDRETDVGKALLHWAAGKRWLRLARFNVGLFLTVDMNRPVRSGVVGGADYMGIISPSGRVLCIETKRRRGGRQSIPQRAFERTIERCGGIYILENDPALPNVRARLAQYGDVS